MRGADITQAAMFSYRTLEERIPRAHPLRKFRRVVDGLLSTMDAELGQKRGDKKGDEFIFHHKVKTTGFQPVSFSCENGCQGGALWSTGTEAILFSRLSTTLCG